MTHDPSQVGNNVSLADIHLYFFCSEYTSPPMLNATPKVEFSDHCPKSQKACF